LALLKHDPSDLEGGIRIIGSFVEHGLRAQARSGNLLTGQLYISLDFYPKAEKVTFDPNARPIMLPTLPSSLELLQEQLQAVIEKIANLPLDRIATNLDGSLNELRNGLKQFNSQTLPGVRTTLDDVRKTLKSASATLADDS